MQPLGNNGCFHHLAKMVVGEHNGCKQRAAHAWIGQVNFETAVALKVPGIDACRVQNLDQERGFQVFADGLLFYTRFLRQPFQVEFIARVIGDHIKQRIQLLYIFGFRNKKLMANKLIALK
ncbi:MAG: hypothetical protein QM664_14050 [Flavihumibacter sp.]